MDAQKALRKQLLDLLRGGHAHMPLDEAVAEFPMDAINVKPPNVPYTPWHLLEHIRITQWDIVEFVRDPKHVSPSWPEGHWPAPDATADERGWQTTIAAVRQELHEFEELVADPATDLTATLPHAPGYNVVREVLTLVDHNAYHIGEFAILRQVMGTWPGK